MTVPSESTTREYYPNFDWIRLLLAVQVVAVHCGIAPRVFINPVPAFLAVSGFVVLGSIEHRPIGQFFVSRALRVLPLLFVSFAAVCVLYGPTAMLYNIRYWLWPTGAAPSNPVVWSLMFEEAFYLLLAALFSIGLYKRKVVIVMICGIVMALAISLKFLFPLRMWYMLGSAFFLGNVMYLFRRAVLKIIGKWTTVTLLAASVLFVHSLPYVVIPRHPGAWVDFLSFAALIAFAIAGPRLPKLSLDLSFSIYLLHCLIRDQLLGFIPPGPRLFFITLLATLPISFAAWHLIESPALGLKRKLHVLWRPQRSGYAEIHVEGCEP
jgi:peptidoglycan/LPS O-acetylase OafA/YrhL